MALRALLDTLTDLVLVVGGDGRVREVGAAARAFLGERAELGAAAMELSDVVAPPYRRRLHEEVPRALHAAGRWRGTVELVTLSGAVMPFDVTVALEDTAEHPGGPAGMPGGDRAGAAGRAGLGGAAGGASTLAGLADTGAVAATGTAPAPPPPVAVPAVPPAAAAGPASAPAPRLPRDASAGGAGGAGGVVVVARDLADRRERQAAERDSRAKDEFVARLGHELRTPLNAVLGFAQLLELEPLPPEQRDEVERILTGGRHMQALLDDVLDLARIRAGGGNLALGPVPVLEIVRGVVELVEPLAERRGIRRVISPADPLVADADRRRLWQVLLNLVANALKYGREGGVVRVGVVPVAGARVRIEVEDDGRGIHPDAMRRLFRPFERLGAERSSVEGSGLGLALSHALVSAMGGVLTAASRPGVGSVFAVVLDTAPSSDDLPEPDPGAPPRRRVVHVSGDPATRALVAQALRGRLGAETIAVPRAALAMDVVRRGRPSLVLLDRDLPDGPAEDLLRHLGDDPATAAVPAVVLSAEADPLERVRLLRAGAAEVVGVPLDVRALLDVVSAHLPADDPAQEPSGPGASDTGHLGPA